MTKWLVNDLRREGRKEECVERAKTFGRDWPTRKSQADRLLASCSEFVSQ